MADRAPERSTGAPWRAARLHRKSSQITRYSKILVTQRSARKSISSTIPMIAASTAAAFRPSASPAALPFDDHEHRLADSGSHRVDRQERVPRGWPSGVIGWTSSSLAPSSFRFFRVETTVPTTLAICMRRFGSCEVRHREAPTLDIPVIDDAHDRGVGRRLGGIERERRLAAADEEDVLADAGADRIERHQRPAHVVPGAVNAAEARGASNRSGWHP